MKEQIEAWLKMAIFVTLFTLPLIAAMWSRQLDHQLAQNQYLPPLNSVSEVTP